MDLGRLQPALPSFGIGLSKSDGISSAVAATVILDGCFWGMLNMDELRSSLLGQMVKKYFWNRALTFNRRKSVLIFGDHYIFSSLDNF